MKHWTPGQEQEIKMADAPVGQSLQIASRGSDWRKQIYHVLGIMSGSSLDGLDIARVRLEAPSATTDFDWHWQLEECNTLSFSAEWVSLLSNNPTASSVDLVEMHVKFGNYLGIEVGKFLYESHKNVDFIASHGHTIYHQPTERGLTFQLGHGAAIAAAAGLPVVCDFRSLDVALGGQGAPLVPLGDRLLFPDYGCCLNLGGISNISVETSTGRLAYDVSACNQLLNALAAEAGQPYDAGGQIARTGQLNAELLAALDAPAWFDLPAPRSLGREWIEAHQLPCVRNQAIPLPDRLHTTVRHISGQIARAIRQSLAAAPSGTDRRVLTTGGGAFNHFLVECLQADLADAATIVVPDAKIVNFKEALIFALLGALRWRGEINTLASVTGARHDSSGGAIYLP